MYPILFWEKLFNSLRCNGTVGMKPITFYRYKFEKGKSNKKDSQNIANYLQKSDIY